MTFEQCILYVVVPYTLLSAGLLAGLYLFHTLKGQIIQLREECDRQAAALTKAVEESERKHAELPRNFMRFLMGTANSGRCNPEAGGFGRAKILSMHERGEGVSAIADTLGIPADQVDLTLKVQRLTRAVS